jgi:hypothetical protein
MPTLTTVTSKTKSTLKWLSISLVYLSILFVVTKIGIAIKERLAPTPPPPPTLAFGKLPSISFPKGEIDRKLTYSLDTITGFLPTVPYQVKVYKMEHIKPQYLALDNARRRTSNVGFRSSEINLSKYWYRWTNEGYPFREITLNIFSPEFTLSSPFLSDPLAARFATNFPNQTSAINTAVEFLSGMSSFPNDIDLTRTKTLSYSITDSILTPVANISRTQVTRVDFFQQALDQLPIYYPNATTSTINLLVASIQNQQIVIGANFTYQPISKSAYTYPIKTSSQAFSELKAQKAYIASYFGSTTNVAIKNVSLGYYIGKEKQDYVMPIVVFEGNDGFFAYVSAVRDEWIGK